MMLPEVRNCLALDYDLTLHGLVAMHVPKAEVGALSDHLAVVYQFDAIAPESFRVSFDAAVVCLSPAPITSTFLLKSRHTFRSCCRRVDEAWTFASDWAERLLFEESRDDQVPRSELWSPGRPRRRRDNDRELDQLPSPGLRAPTPCA